MKKEFLVNSRKKWTLDEDGDDDEEPSAPIEAENNLEDESSVINAPPVRKVEVDGVDNIAINGQQAVDSDKNKLPKKMEIDDEDEEDPLDAFMKSVQAEVRKVNVNVNNGGN